MHNLLAQKNVLPVLFIVENIGKVHSILDTGCPTKHARQLRWNLMVVIDL